MSVKSEILQMLIDADGEFISGQTLGEKLFCSRNAVWKAINSLKNDGYDIKAVTNKGYSLTGGDVLSSAGIKKYLDYDLMLNIKDRVTSTNDVMKDAAEKGAAEGTVIIANEQIKGKGRLGRSFFSPTSGVYISILLRPRMLAEDSLMITTCAAVAVCEAIEAVCDRKCGIKWVNDIFIDGLKVCGILTEASVDFETGGLQYAVLGIGINIANPPDRFPDDLKGIAGALFDSMPAHADIKNRICAALLNSFFKYYENLSARDFMAEYKRRSILIGRKINIIRADSKTPAEVIGIDDNARLEVRYTDGSNGVISTGEVSVRLDD